MKLLCIVIIVTSSLSFTYSQNKEHYQILDKFIKAHNNGSEEAIANFIKETYHPDLYSNIEVKKQIEFYTQIADEFGPLKSSIYSVDEYSPHKLTVQLIKQGEHLKNKYIDPLDILVVEIDLSKENKQYLERGLGLGPLISEEEKN